MLKDREFIYKQILQKKSYLCVGIDPDPERMPTGYYSTPNKVTEFNHRIIEATQSYAVSYKLNAAFFENYGREAFTMMEECASAIPPSCFKIADAKRGDIGNTSKKYAEAFLDHMNFDAITVSPYMGEDSLRPFLEIPGKWIIVLALTSNPGSQDFQQLMTSSGLYLYETVLERAAKWGNPDNIMFVVGATHPSSFENIRTHVPDHFLLVPGVGAQGGSLDDVSYYGANENIGLLVNSSRGILYASNGPDFAEAAGKKAMELQTEMQKFLVGKSLV